MDILFLKPILYKGFQKVMAQIIFASSLTRYSISIMTLSQEEMNQLYAKNYRPCVGYVLGHGGNKADAEDTYQDTWITFLSALQDGKEIDNISGFIWGINKHLWNNHTRLRQKGDFS